MDRHKILLCATGLLALAGAAPSADNPFLTDSRRAMDTMMAGMATPPSGDVDRDFAAMMVPHHQGAIDMAIAELKFGRDARLRRIAQEIIVDQRQEIVVMRRILDERGARAVQPANDAMDGSMVMR